MTKRSKRLEKLRRNPQSVSFDELRQVLEDFGFDLKRSKGSHHVYDVRVGDQVHSLVIPYTKPYIKPVYVKRSLEIIDEIIEEQATAEEEDDHD